MQGNKLFFDKQDYELLNFINKVLVMQKSSRLSEDMLDVHLHAHGIKCLAVSREMRVANAMIRLLSPIDDSSATYRLQAIRTLFDEMLNSAKTKFRRNTARALVEIMKALIRAQGDTHKQLLLASDFRHAAQGKPHVVRGFLQEYGLWEMPEDWSQLTFDHHVHDANSKGRKSPTHLIMDAALKGIRYLTVIYYNFIDEDAASELLQAAKIIGVNLRIGIEFSLPFEDKHVQFVWSPRYANNPARFMEFLAEAPMQNLMCLGREASLWRAHGVYDTLKAWNTAHAQDFCESIGCDPVNLGTLCPEAFTAFVGKGQPTHMHLAEYIFQHITPCVQARRKKIAQSLEADSLTQEELHALREKQNIIEELSIDYLYDMYLNPSLGKNLAFATVHKDDPNRPQILRLTPLSLLDWLSSIQSGGFFTLQLGGLTCEDVLVLLWQCQGLITHLEVFNLQQWQENRLQNSEAINALQKALNLGSAPRLKNIVLLMLQEREAKDASFTQEGPELARHIRRKEVLHEILSHIVSLKNLYASPQLRSRMGSNTTDRPSSRNHMGFVFTETLPSRVRKSLMKTENKTQIPFTIDLHYVVRYIPHLAQKNRILRFISALPGCKQYAYNKHQEWRSHSATVHYEQKCQECNIHLIQATRRPKQETLPPAEKGAVKKAPPLKYLNSYLSNVLKVILGFIPAALAFYYTQTWWVLAYFGPIIWFAITGVRNIMQFVVAGTGFHRSNLLRWNDYVSWSRLCDSLLYTGFSVPLLELGVRTLLLEDAFGVSTISHPVLVYTIMSVVNGLYISWHNIMRGLPQEAVIGNLFRSALAIPMALLFNTIALDFLIYALHVENAAALVATSSAIISKMASDTVAALIEGYADKKNMVRMRNWDYHTKLKDVFHSYEKLDMAFPEEDINDMLRSPRLLLHRVAEKSPTLHQELIINALDLMYFWYYRPRSREVCKHHVLKMTQEERTVFAFLQLVLIQQREVSQLFVDGLVGKNFSSALAFYLKEHRDYVKTLLQICSVQYQEDDNATA